MINLSNIITIIIIIHNCYYNNKTGKKGYDWTELYDPLSESFWYFNARTRLNTWMVPLCFQKNLI